jgi:cytochrome c oxidase subunit IV
MRRKAGIALYVLTLVTVVVGMDISFFRHRFWERLVVNVAIVLIFGAFYVTFLKRAWMRVD